MASSVTGRSIRGAVFAILIAVLAYLALLTAAPNTMLAPLSNSTRLLPRLQQQLRYLSPTTSFLQKPFVASSPLPSSPHTFSSTTAARMPFDKTSFSEAVKHRRTIYGLNKNPPIDDKRIEEILRQAIKDVPSSFNSQSARLVVLVKDEHDKFWDILTTILKVHVPEDKWEHTASRMKMFADAYGTVRSTQYTPTHL